MMDDKDTPMNAAQPTREELNRLSALYAAAEHVALEAEARQLLVRCPEIAFLWQVLGVALLAQGKDGVAALERAVVLQPGDAQAHSNLGNALKDAGRLDEAVASYRCALALNGADPLTHYNLGVALQEQGQLQSAETAYRRSIQLHPGFAQAHYNLGTLLEDGGNVVDAECCYRATLSIQPDHAQAGFNLGRILHHGGRLNEAEACYRSALLVAPDDADIHSNLALLLKAQDRLDDAEATCRRALEFAPDNVGAINNLGLILHSRKRMEEAEQCFRRAIAIAPEFADACGNLGKVLFDQNRLEEAEPILRQAAALKPASAEIRTNLGLTLVGLGKHEEAERFCCEALQLKPDDAEQIYNLGYVLQEQGRLADAETHYLRALAIKPNLGVALNNLGLVYALLGRVAEAEASFRKALECEPDNAKFLVSFGGACMDQGRYAESEAVLWRALDRDPTYFYALDNILYAHTFDGRHSAQACYEDARRYGDLVAAQVGDRKFGAWQCVSSPECLRVGLVSGDMRDHSVGHFLEGFLKEVDRTRLQLVGYPTHREETELTGRVKACFAEWTSLVGLSDEAAARRIHADGIHVLVDLSGHTGHNRLPVFAWKPAPVQVSWLGYCATTGVAEIDYYLADAETLPAEQEGNFTETVWRLPRSYLCFSQPQAATEVGPLPALKNGYVTFGSFNNLTKMTDDVVALWARILHAVPGSRLRLKAKQLAEAAVGERVRAQYRAHGIADESLLLEAPIRSRGGHLGAYGQIDIGLDPFPYNGVTTTLEALWMGVPVLSLAGERFLARQGVGLLTHAGLTDWIAADSDELVAKAVAQAGNLQGLAVLRAGLRQRLLASPLLDAKGFARDFADALWGMWTKRCEQGPVGIAAASPAIATAAPQTPPPGYERLLALFACGDFAALETAAGELLRDYPASGPAWKALGLAQDAQGKDSLPALQKAVELLPDDAEASYNLGLALAARGRLAEAEAAHRRALALQPDSADGQVGLGKVLQCAGRLAEAEECFTVATAMQPEYAEAHHALAVVRFALNHLDEAEASCRRALQIRPDHAEALCSLAVILQGQARYDEAEAACAAALVSRPGMVEALNNLGLICIAGGRYDAAVLAFRQALDGDPGHLEAFSNLLFAYNYCPSFDQPHCLDEARRYGALLERRVGTVTAVWNCDASPVRLRVGLVSGDLRDHSVGYFLEAVVAALAAHGIELFAYPTQPVESALTARIKPAFSAWKPLTGLDDKGAASLIRGDGIHVLLDLSGHTAHNRLPVFAWKPAPVQASWLGYCATTGVAAMDYYIADAWTLPRDQERYFSEKVWRLPGSYLCFSRPVDEVAINALPAQTNGYLTFGSFNNLSKMTDAVVAVWARLLHATPASRLFLKSRQLGDPAACRRVAERFAAHGVAPDRLILEGPVVGRGGHLSAYRRVDIGLDPFPYNGVTTTMEALWMGVPVLALAGDRFLARQGLGILSQAGLGDWVANDVETLLAKAALKSADLAGLAALRSTLRERLLAGPLLDSERFAAQFAAALWAMWRQARPS